MDNAAPPPSPRTSYLATASMICGALSCVPFLGVPAMLLGAAALLRIRRSHGALEGTPLAALGVVLGLFNTGLSAGAVALLAQQSDEPAAPVAIAPPPATATPTAPPATTSPPPRGTAAPRGRPGGKPDRVDGGPMTTLDEVTEVRVGQITLVDIPPTARSFEADLGEQRARAQGAGEKLVLFTAAEGCRPCMSIAAVLTDARMQSALARVRLVRVDVNALGQELGDLGIQGKKIPGFFLLNKQFSPTDGVTGGEWDDDTAENAAPVLGAFVKGTYTRRREAFSPELRPPRLAPPPATTRPKGTFL